MRPAPRSSIHSELESKDKEVKVANEAIPIIKLANEQKLRIDCKAVFGNGAKHAKFQPGIISYDEEKEGIFNFSVESFGQMPPREIINKALGSIKDELKEIGKEVKKI